MAHNTFWLAYKHPDHDRLVTVGIAQDESGSSFHAEALEENDSNLVVSITLTETGQQDIFDRVNEFRADLEGTVPEWAVSFLQGPKADMPVAGQPGGEERFYIATDEPAWYRDIGYEWADSDAVDGPTYSWEDIASSGTALTFTDDDSETVDIGFDFPFLSGQVVDEIHVGSNGLLGVGSDLGVSNYSNKEIPASAVPNNIICPFWDDLNPTAGGTVHYESLGTEPDRRFIVQYTGIKRYATADYLTFQAVLYESGNILFQYKEMPGDGDGSSASIGVEGREGAKGIQISHNAAYVHDEMAVLIQPKWELMFGADAFDADPSQRSLVAADQRASAGDHNHILPSAPSNLVAVGGDEQAVLTWDNPQNPSITSYEFYNPRTSTWETIPGSDQDTVTYTMLGLNYGSMYNLSLRAVNAYADGDGVGAIAQALATIENRPPVANAGPDQIVDAGETVTLSGSGIDEFPDSLTYEWRQHVYGVTLAVTLNDPSNAKATFVAPGNVRYGDPLYFILTVTDRNGATDTDFVYISIRNFSPTANAGEDQTVGTADTVTLSGSATDPDPGDTLTYTWVQTSGPSVTLSDANAASPTFTAPESGTTLEFLFLVEDSSHGIGYDYVSITVAREDTPGTVTFSSHQPVWGTALTASLADWDGSISDLTWQWASSSSWDSTTETWTDISGGSSASYTPVAADWGHYLQATASYGDYHGANKTASAITVNSVMQPQS